jgi:hypothetical protein
LTAQASIYSAQQRSLPENRRSVTLLDVRQQLRRDEVERDLIETQEVVLLNLIKEIPRIIAGLSTTSAARGIRIRGSARRCEGEDGDVREGLPRAIKPI